MMVVKENVMVTSYGDSHGHGYSYLIKPGHAQLNAAHVVADETNGRKEQQESCAEGEVHLQG